MKKLILASLITLGATISLVSCHEEESMIQPNNTHNKVQQSNVLMSKEYSPVYYAGLKMRKFIKLFQCGDSIGFCPSSKLQDLTLDEYTSMSVNDSSFKVKITPLSDSKISMNVIVSDGYFVEDVFEIAEDIKLTIPSYSSLQNIKLNSGSYAITKIDTNEYNINIDAVVD